MAIQDEGTGALPVGSQVGRYTLLGLAGSPDRFGISYRASSADGREVTLKEFFPREFVTRDGERMVARLPDLASALRWGLLAFVNEARVLAGFRHPDVAEVYEVFEANGTAYFSMEALAGETLAEHLERVGRLDAEATQRLLLPLLEGLGRAHAEGFLHRDIRPDHLQLRADGSPVLVDFGAGQNAMRFKSRDFVGGLAAGYAAPEEYSLQAKQSPATDLYSIAALAYRCLSGQAPPEVPQRLRDPHGFDAEARLAGLAPPALVAAVAWGLRLDPAQRPASAADFAAALRGEQAVPAAAPGTDRAPAVATAVAAAAPAPAPTLAATPPPAPVEARRRQPLLWVASVAVLLAVTATGWTLLSQPPAADPIPRPPEPAAAAAPESEAPVSSAAEGARAEAAVEELALGGLEKLAADLLKREQEAATAQQAIAEAEAAQRAQAEQARQARELAAREALDQARREPAAASATGTSAEPAADSEASRTAQLEQELAALQAEREREARAAAEAAALREREAAAAREAERQRLARIQTEKARCELHVSEVFSNASLDYDTLTRAEGVVKLANGNLRLPEMRTDDGRAARVEVTPAGCATLRASR
ncbi:MAG TPA: protein kinase [Nevskiaceae bacterium]|nr:protein kinase [Nevskiaceae bacterium]